jgi:Pectate lyase superfamily protein
MTASYNLSQLGSHYNQGGTGAVDRTTASKLQESVSVLDFGADPTGATDSTTAFTNAVAASTSIIIPSGTYKITGTITTSSGDTFIGAGRGATTIVPTGNFDVFSWTGSATGGGIRNLYINASGMTGGNVISMVGQTRWTMMDVTIAGGYNGILIQDQNVASVQNVWINGLTGAYAIKVYGSTAGSSNVCDLDNIEIGFSTNTGSSPTGVVIDSGVQTVDIRHVAVEKGYRGLAITNTLNYTNSPAFVTALDFQAENMYDAGVYIDGGTAQTENHYFHALYCGGSVSSAGVYINDGSASSPSVQNVQIIGGQIGNNNKQGVYCAGSYVKLLGCHIYNNSKAGSASYPSVEVVGRSASINRGFTMTGCLSGQWVGYSTQLTSYGLQIDTYCAAYSAVGNDFRLNVTGDYLDSSNDATSVILGNAEAATTGSRIPGSLQVSAGNAVPAGGGSSVALTASSTAGLGVYFGSGAPTVSAAQGSLYVRTDGSSTSTRLYVNTNGSTTWTNVVTAA